MFKTPCSSGANLIETTPDIFTVCAWGPNKASFEEGIEAIGVIRGRIVNITHGICNSHKEEMKSLYKKHDQNKKAGE